MYCAAVLSWLLCGLHFWTSAAVNSWPMDLTDDLKEQVWISNLL